MNVMPAVCLKNFRSQLAHAYQEIYITSYINEGCIASDGSLRIFPVAKSTEIMMINKTDRALLYGIVFAALENGSPHDNIVDFIASVVKLNLARKIHRRCGRAGIGKQVDRGRCGDGKELL